MGLAVDRRIAPIARKTESGILVGGSLGTIVATALTRPSDLTPADLCAVVTALDPRDATHWAPPLTAILYARPDLAGPELIERLGALLASDGIAEPAVDAAAVALESFAGSALAAPALEAVVCLLGCEALGRAPRARLVPALRAFANWDPEILDPRRLVEIAGEAFLGPHRDALLGEVLEPLLASAPERVTEALLERLLAVFEGCARLRYTLHMLGERPTTPAPVARRAVAWNTSAFPARAAARGVLARQSLHVLVVLNARIGQGDEIIRLAALLQALLDAHLGLRLTVLTPRTHLYDHPRVRAVPIVTPAAVTAALDAPYDGVIHVCEPAWPDVAWEPSIDARVLELIAAGPPLVITAHVGHNHFVCREVKLESRDIAAERALDRLALDNVYDGCARLLAELGLGSRVAEEVPVGPSLLTGVRSSDAERAWADLTAGLPPPIALVNPYGGAHRLKGYPPERHDQLAAEVSGLVLEGYSVVLLPNGTTWGRAEALAGVLSRLAPPARRRVVVAPDPGEPDSDRRVLLTERPDLSYADRVMRLFKYFVASADLVVAVEGWMTHLAYALGRPFRLVLRARSQSFGWHPSPRSARQRLVAALSPRAGPTPPETLGETDPPALPPLHRRALFVTALAGLPALGGNAVPILLRALASEDYDVRATAVAALGRLLPAETPRSAVLGALRDREPLVRRTAADALLASGVDCARDLGPRSRELLLSHRAIAAQDWAAVHGLGPAAIPALFVAAEGDNDPVRREARWVLARVLAGLGIGAAERPRS